MNTVKSLIDKDIAALKGRLSYNAALENVDN